MTAIKATLDDALRHAAAQRRRFRLNDPREQLVFAAARAFRLLLEDERLTVQLTALLEEVQAGMAPAPPAPP